MKFSSDSQSESSKSCKLERTPSLLIDSFAQTDTQNLDLLDTATVGAASSDMVDSGVDSQHKSVFFRDRNISLTEDDECLSFHDDRFRDKTIIMSEEEDEADKPTADDKKDDSDEVSFA